MQEVADISAKLKQYRMERQWTLRQIASATGLAIVTIWNIENGRVKPHELTIAKIMRALPNLDLKTA